MARRAFAPTGRAMIYFVDYAKRLSFTTKTHNSEAIANAQLKSKTFLDEPSSKPITCVPSVASGIADYRTSRFMFLSNKISKTFRTRRSLENVLFSESSSILVSRKRDKEIDMRSCLSKASSSNDYENRTFGLRAQDVFAPFFLILYLSVTKEKEKNSI